MVELTKPTKSKCHYQNSDIPVCVNDGEAFCKMFIPTMYWYMGNQPDIWVYNDNKLTKDLQKVFSTVYTSDIKDKVGANSPVFGMVRHNFNSTHS